jgi:hypothetical protein
MAFHGGGSIECVPWWGSLGGDLLSWFPVKMSLLEVVRRRGFLEMRHMKGIPGGVHWMASLTGVP